MVPQVPEGISVLLQWHLGLPLIPEQWAGVPCPLQCGSVVDPYGDHTVSCRKNRCWERHQAVEEYFGLCLLRQCRLHVSLHEYRMLCSQYRMQFFLPAGHTNGFLMG